MGTKQFFNKRFRKHFIFIMVLQLLFSSCGKEYEYGTACVYKSSFYNWGRGYYKLKIYYSFIYKDSLFHGCVKTPGVYNYNADGIKHFKNGDSVFVKFPIGKPENSELANYKVKRKKER